MMIATTAKTRALEWNVFSINQSPVPATAVVSFSIGYPKGWHVSQNSNWQRDIYFDLVTPYPGEIIGSFWRTPTTADLTMFTIFDSHGRPAKDAAESFARNMKEKSLSPVKTAAGDTGWLLESERDFKIGGPIPAEFKGSGLSVHLIPAFTKEKVIDHQYFFHSGSKGSIRIEIMTPAWNSALRSQLDKLILNTLRFSDP